MNQANYKILSGKSLLYLILLLPTAYCLLAVFTGCGKKSSKQAQQTKRTMPKPKLKIPEYVPPPPPRKYTYRGNKYRDPLMPEGGRVVYATPGTTGAESGRMTGDKLATLQLKGIFRDKKTGGIAIITDTSGNSYILKNRKLYDRKRKIVKGVAGVVKKKSVILFCKNIKVELKLKKPGEGRKK